MSHDLRTLGWSRACCALSTVLAAACVEPEPMTPADAGPGEVDAGAMREPPVIPDNPYALALSGSAARFSDGEPVDAMVAIDAQGMNPPRRARVMGTTFSLDGVPAFTAIHLTTRAEPGYRETVSPLLPLGGESLNDVTAWAVSDAYASELEDALGAGVGADTAIVLARMRDPSGFAAMGTPLSAFEVADAPRLRGPYALNADLAPVTEATEVLSSGWVAFLGVPEGRISIEGTPGARSAFLGTAPTVADGVTIIDVTVLTPPTPEPTAVSFAQDVVPIFTFRGCVACHGGPTDRRQDGGLTLGGPVDVIYEELTTEMSLKHAVSRIDADAPTQSLIISMPLYESPSDIHPTTIFTDPRDPDLLVLAAWIGEGAEMN